jgi:hypothetical protein
MASRCTCDRIEAMLEGLPWFKALPAGARWLCFKLAKLMATAAYDGAVPYSDAARVSLLVSMTVAETETYLETLVETGLLARDEAGRLLCPAMEGISARARAARENGRKGGRPRKEPAVTPQNDARQMVAKLPIPGGLAKPTETQAWETPSAGVPPRTTTTVSEVKSSSSGLSPEACALGREAMEVAGMVTRRPDWTPAAEWLAAGHTHAHVIAAIRARVAKPGYVASRVNSLRYFTDALGEPSPPPGPRDSTPWLDAYDAWDFGGRIGPAPHPDDFRKVA